MKYIDFMNKYWNLNSFSPMLNNNNVVPGNNGLYQENETVFRNASHWLLILKELESINLDVNVQIKELINMFEVSWPEKGSFVARESSKNRSNGLIGTSWIVESLSEFANYEINQKDILSLCELLLLKYPFDYKLGIWPKIVEPDGILGKLDRTFNHQLWMSMAHFELLKYSNNVEIKKRADFFIDNLKTNLKINKYGVVYHTLGVFPHYQRTLLKRFIDKSYKNDMHTKEWGYHAFNLLAIAKIYKNSKNQYLHELLTRLLIPVKTEVFWKKQIGNRYGSSYNPVGLEVGVALDAVNASLEEICRALNFHFKSYFNPETFSFENSSDDATLNARIYELTSLSTNTKNQIHYNRTKNEWTI